MSAPLAKRTLQPDAAELIDGVDPVYGDVTGFETVAVPPGNRTVRVCAGWPECDCNGDCETIVLGPTTAERRILFSVLVVTALAGIGLIWLGLR